MLAGMFTKSALLCEVEERNVFQKFMLQLLRQCIRIFYFLPQKINQRWRQLILTVITASVTRIIPSPHSIINRNLPTNMKVK